MADNKPLLSIGLPTNGAVQWVIPTLKSIYSQGVDDSLFEVVITDNGENSCLEDNLVEFSNHDNLRYYKTTDKGFLNLVTCLQRGSGIFNKMLNHRMILSPGALSRMIDVIQRYKTSKPSLYFLNGENPRLKEYTECDNIDEFVKSNNIFCSWSAGIGFWDVDLPALSKIIPNEMFPNASLIFEHRENSKYVIWNGVYGEMQDDSGKGGYDLFHTFGVVLPSIIEKLMIDGKVSSKTFLYFKYKLFRYLCGLYYLEVVCDTERSFIIGNIRKDMSFYYNDFLYYIMILYANLKKYIVKK